MRRRSSHGLVLRGAQDQDRAAAVRVGSDALLVVVADGAGGLAGGDLAAERVLRSATERGPQLAVGGATDHGDALGRIPDPSSSCAIWSTRGPAPGEHPRGDPGTVGREALVELTEHQVRKPLLGSGSASVVGFRAALDDGLLVAGSDGLFAYAPRACILEVARSGHGPERIAHELVGLVRLPSGALPDDVCVVVVGR